jgi:hypothetical protein
MKEWKEAKKAFDNFLKKYCGIEKVTEENFEYIRKKARELSLRPFAEIGNELGVSSSTAYYLISFLADPSIYRLEYLKLLWHLSQTKEGEWIPIEEIRKEFPSIPLYISLLRTISAIQYEKRGRKGYVKINRDILEKFYPEVKNSEYRKISQTEINKNKAKQGERIKQALEILGVKSIDELNEQHIPQIKRLAPVDFLERNIQINSREVHAVKKQLIEKIEKKNNSRKLSFKNLIFSKIL